MLNSGIIYIVRFLPVILLIIAPGCKKNDNYFISGQMVDPNQSVYVSGVKVELWTQKIKSGIFESNYQLSGELMSGPDGKFQFELEVASYTGIKLIFSKDNYHGWESQVNTESLTKEPGNYIEYQLLPKAWLIFHVLNQDPFDSADYFEYRLMNAYSGCEDCCREDKYQFFGMEIDQTLRCQSAGQQDLLIQWSRRKNKEQIFKTETFVIKPFDTTRIELIY